MMSWDTIESIAKSVEVDNEATGIIITLTLTGAGLAIRGSLNAGFFVYTSTKLVLYDELALMKGPGTLNALIYDVHRSITAQKGK